MTGGSSGIGKSFIELCGTLRPELRFCNLSRSAPDIKEGKLKLCHRPCDLSDAAAVERAAAGVHAWLDEEGPEGGLLLINNSGFGSYGLFPEPDLSHQLEMLDVNVRGLVQLTGLLLPALRARGGAIMNIASTAAFQPTPFMATYGATKAFVLNWSVALNEELRGSGVRALAVCPGPTATQFFRRAGLKPGSVADVLSMTCEEVVMQSLGALGARKAVVVTGWKNKLGSMAGALAPKAWAARVARWGIGRYRVRRADA
ncbi:MAG TPA: SDR family NAD(P)-dependent oxidoreductase [Opitutus sp.]|nr:SDR family NAD(P)-dependent oxidoreductase [Opitutus sp.]